MRKTTKIDEAIRQKILAEKSRTGVGSIRLLKNAKSVPVGLTVPIIESWVRGKTKTANQEHVDFVLAAYTEIEEPLKTSRRPTSHSGSRVRVDDELRQQLAFIHSNAPTNYLRNAPGGFSATSMRHVLTGRNTTLEKAVLEFLLGGNFEQKKLERDLELGEWQLSPPRSPMKIGARNLAGVEYVEIDDSTYQRLHHEIARSRVSPRALFEWSEEVPRGLKRQTVDRWLSGAIRSAEPEHLKWVLEAYEAIPSP